MRIDDILAQEDERFNSLHNNTVDDRSPMSTKKAPLQEKKAGNLSNMDDLRNFFVEGLKKGDDDPTILKGPTKNFKKGDLVSDLKAIVSKYGLNPNGAAENQIISTFVSNLYSVGLVKTEY